jgi:hypothetical protein
MFSRKTLIAALLAAGLIFGMPVANAQEVDPYEETPPPEVIDDQDENDDVDQDDIEVLGDNEEAETYEDPPDPSVGPSALAVTGGDVAGLAAIGGVMVLAGFALSRRRRTES